MMTTQRLRRTARAAVMLAAAAAAGTAAAHPGHGGDLAAGLAHPFAGLDHLLAMAAVGAWSALALPARRRWQAPASFVAAMLVAALAGASGVVVPGLELLVAASVIGCGALLAAGRRLRPSAGLAVVAMIAAAHGLAHGVEAPAGAGWGYAAGFVAATAALHGAGLGAATLLARRHDGWWRAAGAVLGLAGVAMLAARL